MKQPKLTVVVSTMFGLTTRTYLGHLNTSALDAVNDITGAGIVDGVQYAEYATDKANVRRMTWDELVDFTEQLETDSNNETGETE